MRTSLEQLRIDACARIPHAANVAALEALEIEFLGRKQGKLTAILRGLGSLTPDERKAAGALANTVKEEIEHLIGDRRAALDRVRMANLAEAEWMDVTAPGTAPTPRGALHPIAEAIHDIERIFERIGFIRSRHPEVDSEHYAFEALHMPPDHPARDEWETFFVKPIAHSQQPQARRIVLTPHTSNGQVREMEQGKLPIRMINIGKCYRRQIDATHTPMFHQFEGLLVDRDVAITHLKGTLEYFVRSYFGPDRTTRLRPYHFQFTEPSFEIDISCAVCGGSGISTEAVERKTEVREGGDRPWVRQTISTSESTRFDRCRVCKGGWLELGGAGMVHPAVLRAGGVDPDTYGGFAFGWGVERVLMMKLGVQDIRLLYANDPRWLAQ